MSELKPFFSIVIPLYNKASHVKETIETVRDQTFQNFEIIIIDDGSIDESYNIVKEVEDKRIKIFQQQNQGVSVARNNGIKESKAPYIAFLDADDIWLPEFLSTIYKLIQNYPEGGLYATSYKRMNSHQEYENINIQALPQNEYIGILPNYFKSVVVGDNLVWTSAVCIPKKIFIENDIWFPVGEKYGEDQYVWARVAMKFDIVYNTNVCAIYKIEAENNTIDVISSEKEPHKSILILKKFRDSMADINKIKYFDKYIEKHISRFVLLNILKGEKFYAFKQLIKYKLSIGIQLKFLLYIIIPKFSYPFLKDIKKMIK